MDLDSTRSFRLSSLGLGLSDTGTSHLAGDHPLSSTNHRRSSFTEYRSSLLHSGDILAAPTTTTAPSTGRTFSYLSGRETDLFAPASSKAPPTNANSTPSKYSFAPRANYSSAYDKYHLDDNDFKYSFLGDISNSARLLSSAGGAQQHHHHQDRPSGLFGAPPFASTATTTTTTATATASTAAAPSAISGLPSSTKYSTTNTAPNTSAPLDHLDYIPSTKRTTDHAGSLLAGIGLSEAAATSKGLDAKADPPLSQSTTGNSTALKSQQQQTSQSLLNDTEEMLQIHDTVDTIEIPARGRCKVFMAKYGYDPFKQSPNDNPDAELAFNAGDYIMVFDDIDEDGYFIGELMDGRRGFVPSNWLYRLTSNDLFEFQANVLYKQAGAGSGSGHNTEHAGHDQLDLIGAAGFGNNHSSLTSKQLLMHNTGNLNATNLKQDLSIDDCLIDNNSYPPEFYDAIISDTMNHSNFQHLLAPEDYHRMNDYVDLDDVNEVDDECLSDYERAEAEQMRRAVPPPQRLVLERQLNKCILIAWLHPQATKGSIVSYQVYVDGVLKSTVPSGDRTKALLEGVDSNIPHRISVRAIDLHGRHSNDAGCTIVIGQKIPFAPSCVKASHITSDSALISWLPCNSNFHHVVAVNSVEVQTVRPGVYKHLINGLSANTLYRVWVRAKPGKILSIDEKNPSKLESLTTYVDFKTMPKSLPDPPVNVQVEAGPQRRTLLITWLPLTLNDFGSSNGCAVTGYAVFAGHKKLAEIDSPTGDHALLDIGELESLHKKSVTVRTKSGENLSQDSMPCQIPDEYLKANTGRDLSSNNHHHHQTSARYSSATHHAQQASSIGQSPSRNQQRTSLSHHHQASTTGGALQRVPAGARYAPVGTSAIGQHSRVSRPLTRSLHNLESDLESRRSSIPAIEITREVSGSEIMNQTESYSEEEFESSMRFRGALHRNQAGQRAASGSRAGGHVNRFRTRHSHSVDGHHLSSRHFPSQSTASASQRGATNRGLAGNSTAGALNAGEIRYFVALFDYDPSTMSPNPNAAAEELAFKEGSIIKIYGGLGEDGFYKGELDNQATGYVPCNVITEITDPNILATLYEKSDHQLLLSGAGVRQAQVNLFNQQQQLDQMQHQSQVEQQQQQQGMQASSVPVSATTVSGSSGAVKRMVALYDYDPQENSPNADTESEIPFKTGDIIFVYGKMDTDGFYMGEVERTKQRGLVPSNFLREEPKPMSKQQQQQQNQFVQLQQQQLINQSIAQQQPQAHFASGQQQIRGSQPNLIRGQLGPGVQQQSSGINRPNSLSLNAQNNAQQQMIMNNMQQQQQQQQLALQMQQNGLVQPTALLQQKQLQGNAQLGANALAGGINSTGANSQMGGQFINANQQMIGARTVLGGNMLNQQQQQRAMVGGNQQMNMQQQPQFNNSQQQSGPGGVLSNLLSSGKQIIGAATTPRTGNQPPGAFMQGANLQQHQQGGLVGNQPMMGSNMNVGGMQPVGAQNMMTNQQMLDAGGNFLNRANPQMQQQSLGLVDAGQQQQHNSYSMGGLSNNLMGNQQQHQQQPQQQQPYSQMGNFNRGAAGMATGAGGMNQMGEEPGGNILNTVKNMFKL